MKTVGRLTGNRRLRARGHRHQAKGNVKQYGTKIKDALKRSPRGGMPGNGGVDCHLPAENMEIMASR